MIWLVRLCMLPTPTPDDAGHASFLGPSRWGRARARLRPQKERPKKSSPQASPQAQRQQHTVNSSVSWLGSRARGPEGPKTNGKKARAAQHASQPQQRQNGQNSCPLLSTAVFVAPGFKGYFPVPPNPPAKLANHHYASIASPAVMIRMMISITTHRRHLQLCLT